MRTILGLLITFLLIIAALLGLGVAVGTLVNLLFPAIDFGIASLMGVIAVAISIHFIGRIMSAASAGSEDTEEEGDTNRSFIVVEPLPIRRRKRRKPSRQ
jgi:hypothetical protein